MGHILWFKDALLFCTTDQNLLMLTEKLWFNNKYQIWYRWHALYLLDYQGPADFPIVYIWDFASFQSKNLENQVTLLTTSYFSNKCLIITMLLWWLSKRVCKKIFHKYQSWDWKLSGVTLFLILKSKFIGIWADNLF